MFENIFKLMPDSADGMHVIFFFGSLVCIGCMIAVIIMNYIKPESTNINIIGMIVAALGIFISGKAVQAKAEYGIKEKAESYEGKK